MSCELTVRTCDTSEGQMWIGEGFNVSFTVENEESDSWYFHDGRLKQGEVSTKTFSLWGPPSKMSIRSDGEDRFAAPAGCDAFVSNRGAMRNLLLEQDVQREASNETEQD